MDENMVVKQFFDEDGASQLLGLAIQLAHALIDPANVEFTEEGNPLGAWVPEGLVTQLVRVMQQDCLLSADPLDCVGGSH